MCLYLNDVCAPPRRLTSLYEFLHDLAMDNDPYLGNQLSYVRTRNSFRQSQQAGAMSVL